MGNGAVIQTRSKRAREKSLETKVESGRIAMGHREPVRYVIILSCLYACTQRGEMEFLLDHDATAKHTVHD